MTREEIGRGPSTPEVAGCRPEGEGRQRPDDEQTRQPLKVRIEDRPAVDMGRALLCERRERTSPAEVRNRTGRRPHSVHLTFHPCESHDRTSVAGPCGHLARIGDVRHPSAPQRTIEIGRHRAALGPLDQAAPLDGIIDGPERVEMVVHQPPGIDIEVSDAPRSSTDEGRRCPPLRRLERQLTSGLAATEHRDSFAGAHVGEIHIAAVHHAATKLDTVGNPAAAGVRGPHHLASHDRRPVTQLDSPRPRRTRLPDPLQAHDRFRPDPIGELTAVAQRATERREGRRRRATKRPDRSSVGLRRAGGPERRSLGIRVHVGHVVRVWVMNAWTSQHIDPLLLEAALPRVEPGSGRIDDTEASSGGGPVRDPPRGDGQRLRPSAHDDRVGQRCRPCVRPLYDRGMAQPTVTPALLEDLIRRCRVALDPRTEFDRAACKAILTDLGEVHDHLARTEQRDLGEWIRDLPTEQLGDFLADMEVTARQADTDSDIGSFISALADWQTTAEASRHGWTATDEPPDPYGDNLAE